MSHRGLQLGRHLSTSEGCRIRPPAHQRSDVILQDVRSFGAHQAHLNSSTQRSRAATRVRAASEAAPAAADASTPLETLSKEGEVLKALEVIMDPDFGMNIVECGFIKDLEVSEDGEVAFRLELTTPACPIKDQFERDANSVVEALPWVTKVNVKMDAQPVTPLTPEEARPHGLASVKHIIAVSSCKGGVGKSTTAVNLAYTLTQMGARVGIFDADVYGPSLPTMISPELRVLEMDPETKEITPVDYLGVKCVSFGFAGQGSAIMRGPMVSGLIQQLVLTSKWGELDYLVVDFPPGTGDIQLTLCQNIQFDAAVVVTTPQKLAFIDVAKGIRMFAKMAVPCVAVAENMSFFDAPDGQRFHPFGKGSGQRIQEDFGLPNLVQFPITEALSLAGDGGKPLVVSEPAGPVGTAFSELAVAVVREVAKLRNLRKNSVRFDAELGVFVARLPQVPGPNGAGDGSAAPASADGIDEFLLHPAIVRRSDTSARSVNEWTGERILKDEDIAEDVKPQDVQALGNYAVQITWEDGFNQVAPFDLLRSLQRLSPEEAQERAVNAVPVPDLD